MGHAVCGVVRGPFRPVVQCLVRLLHQPELDGVAALVRMSDSNQFSMRSLDLFGGRGFCDIKHFVIVDPRHGASPPPLIARKTR
jgi:hypothetical protein